MSVGDAAAIPPDRPSAAGGSHLLEVRDLAVRFDVGDDVVRAVDGVSFTLGAGEALAIVGESGPGKSATVLSLLGLLPTPPARVVGGTAHFGGRDLLSLSRSELRRVRGRQIAMVFQDPATSLNPVLTIGTQLAEGMRTHLGATASAARARAAELLTRVGLPGEHRQRAYPHELSGGQRQRVMIAMALACEPSLLIADEPTTALDVTVQAQIVDLLTRLQRTLGMGLVWITHDLALAAGCADTVAVMYAGRFVELAPVAALFQRPRHPYTLGLLRAAPRWDAPRGERLLAVPGAPPDLRTRPRGCAFAPRCGYAVERCRAEDPPLRDVGPAHRAACWRWDEL
jgi:oligopeptide/dipeptide ABC transporter ATP-binding protein